MRRGMIEMLSAIVDEKRREVEERRKAVPLESFSGGLSKSTRSFRDAIRRTSGGARLIAELKFASPSEGVIRNALDDEVIRIAKLYDRYAAAVSVLTDKKHFSGDMKYLRIVRENTSLPVLRKDFIVDEYQVYESRYHGADAILLIVAVLGKQKISQFMDVAARLGMDCVVEVHDERELGVALECGAGIIGINNRDLSTMSTDLGVTSVLSGRVPAGALVVSESGIRTGSDICALPERVDAVLVGTSLMKGDVEKNVREITGELR